MISVAMTAIMVAVGTAVTELVVRLSEFT